MVDKQCDASGHADPHDTAATAGSHGPAAHDAGTVPATTTGNANGHTANDSAAETATLSNE